MKLERNLKTRYKELLYELLITILGCDGIEDFSSSICLPHDVHITASIGIFAPQNFTKFCRFVHKNHPTIFYCLVI